MSLLLITNDVWRYCIAIYLDPCEISCCRNVCQRLRSIFPVTRDTKKTYLNICESAAYHGNLGILNSLYVKDHRDVAKRINLSRLAAFGGQIPILEWARKHGTPISHSIIHEAARGGQIHVLEWALRKNNRWNAWCRAAKHAAMGGQVHILEWLMTLSSRPPLFPDDKAIVAAVQKGYLETLKWFMSQGCRCRNPDLCNIAARSGHLEVMVYLRKQRYSFSAHIMRDLSRSIQGAEGERANKLTRVYEWIQENRYR